MIFFRAAGYLKYTILSRHRKGFGIHSPFIFDIVSGVFRNKKATDVVLKVKNARKRLLNDKRIVEVNDLGSGKNRSNLRRVSEIAKRSAIPEKYGLLLASMAERFGTGAIIELGTSLGISTMYLAASCPASVVYSIDGSGECLKIAEESLGIAEITNVELINNSFDKAIADLKTRGVKPSLVFVDGDHMKEPTIRYFKELSSMCDEQSVIIIDDINYSREMKEAWDEIRYAPGVSSTIDVFRMGFVFFRQSITQKHYMVRH